MSLDLERLEYIYMDIRMTVAYMVIRSNIFSRTVFFGRSRSMLHQSEGYEALLHGDGLVLLLFKQYYVGQTPWKIEYETFIDLPLP